jgi:RimJ/RimL family protein N-acetyltransferase/GNAT superfamily N-acetyltransferase
MAITYRDDAVIDVAAAVALYQRSTLAARRPVERADAIAGMLANANLTISAWCDARLVGIARTLTDFTYVAYLADLAVDAAFQRQGIGQELIAQTRARLAPECMIVLLAAPDARAYYAKLGFEHHPRAWVLKGGQQLILSHTAGASTAPRQPMLETPRLTLRPFALADAADVQRLAGDRAIADTTLNIPHPYDDGMAEAWISTHQPKYAAGELANFAVIERAGDALVGAIGLMIKRDYDRAELGYWIGRPYWGRGYCTEAARAVLAFGFTTLNLVRIHATHLSRNPASGRVMQKIGMTREGMLRQHVKKWDRHEDLVEYGILREEWRQAAQASAWICRNC